MTVEIKNKQFVTTHTEKTRGKQRATGFIHPYSGSLSLRGPTAKGVCENLVSASGVKKKTFEIIILDSAVKTERLKGDVVSASTVFPSSKNLVWNQDGISFLTDDGILVNMDEYAYVQKNGINKNQFFAKTFSKTASLTASWKFLTRKSAEARKDKAINILYLTFASVAFTPDETGSQIKRGRANAPLFFCQVKEDVNSKNHPRFTVVGEKLIVNSILARMIKSQYMVDMLDGIDKTEISFENFEKCVQQIKENLSEVSDIEVFENDMRLCLLDSSNESMCQAVERNIDKIVKCPLVTVFSEAEPYQIKSDENNLPFAIYPLPADDSQREVVQKVLAGDSLNVSAGPGTGKSQTLVNLCANLLLQNKTICVLSEKAAANEVFVNYSSRCGMNLYCLEVNERTTVKEIVSQIKRSLNFCKVYVETDSALAVINAYRDVEKEFSKINAVYDLIPEVGYSLYSVIGQSMCHEDLECAEFLHFENKNYRKILYKIDDLQQQLIDTASEEEWRAYILNGTTEDEEQDEMFNEAIDEIHALGIDFLSFVKQKNVKKCEIATVLKAQVARRLANEYVESEGLKEYGNRKLKMLYKKLMSASASLRAVSGAFVQQQLGLRILKASKNNRFVELLDRLATSKITLQAFFNTYGKDIVNLCPIIVSTPGVLVGYDNLNAFDVLVIDESSQMPFTNVLPFLIGDRQLVAFGDPLQLDITSYFESTDMYEQADDETYDLAQTDKSILHVMQGKLPGCQLKYHYRSKTQHLITVSNERCYDGLLNVAPDIYIGRENLPKTLGYKIIKVDNPKILSKANVTEAEEIVKCIIQVRKEQPDKAIGVITLNENQQTEILDQIEVAQGDDLDLSALLGIGEDLLWVRTLDNAQGKEADVVMITVGHCHRNKDGSITKRISGIDREGGLNRLNVLFTRAREKVIVVMSFSYKELKDTTNKGIFRFYEYLRYANTGEFATVDCSKTVDDKFNKVLSEKISGVVNGYKTSGKLGKDNMTVDVALSRAGESRFAYGMLLPDKKLSANAICTKVAVLERAGWNLIPLSPITCFTKPKTFNSQIEKEVNEVVKYTSDCQETYITDNPPPKLFKFQDFLDGDELIAELNRQETQNEQQEKSKKFALTASELLSIDFDKAYQDVWNADVKNATPSRLIIMANLNNMQARLRIILLKLPDYIKRGLVSDLISAVYKGYGYDHVFGYFYAQLLRFKGDEADAPIVEKLTEEAVNIGVKIQ